MPMPCAHCELRWTRGKRFDTQHHVESTSDHRDHLYTQRSRDYSSLPYLPDNSLPLKPPQVLELRLTSKSNALSNPQTTPIANALLNHPHQPHQPHLPYKSQLNSTTAARHHPPADGPVRHPGPPRPTSIQASPTTIKQSSPTTHPKSPTDQPTIPKLPRTQPTGQTVPAQPHHGRPIPTETRVPNNPARPSPSSRSRWKPNAAAARELRIEFCFCSQRVYANTWMCVDAVHAEVRAKRGRGLQAFMHCAVCGFSEVLRVYAGWRCVDAGVQWHAKWRGTRAVRCTTFVD